MTQCPNCTQLTQEVQRLRQENERLRKEVVRLKNFIRTLADYCQRIFEDAAHRMQKHLPRGTWAYLKGRAEMAGAVYNALRSET